MQVTLGHIPTDEGTRLREENEERCLVWGKGGLGLGKAIESVIACRYKFGLKTYQRERWLEL
jgi:hypothetical protein